MRKRTRTREASTRESGCGETGQAQEARVTKPGFLKLSGVPLQYLWITKAGQWRTSPIEESPHSSPSLDPTSWPMALVNVSFSFKPSGASVPPYGAAWEKVLAFLTAGSLGTVLFSGRHEVDLRAKAVEILLKTDPLLC